MLTSGGSAPLFSLTNQKNEVQDLAALRGHNVLVYFYPRADTPGCTQQACGLRDIAAQVGDNPDAKQRANYGLTQDKWTDGITNSPHGGSIDKDGNLIVTEWSAFGRLHKFLKKN